MNTRKRGRTSEMQVTSIRLEPELKERLREISGEQGYQTLIRDVLWQFVEHQTIPNRVQSLPDRSKPLPWRENWQPTLPSQSSRLSLSAIRATFRVIAQKEERCAITGQCIQPQQRMWLGLTENGELVPLSLHD